MLASKTIKDYALGRILTAMHGSYEITIKCKYYEIE